MKTICSYRERPYRCPTCEARVRLWTWDHLPPPTCPADGAALSAGNATDDDMLGPQHEGAVYLIGEHMLTMGGLIACVMLASRAMASIAGR